MANADVYAVVYGTGRADTMKDGSTYWSVLQDVFTAYQSAGGNWNRPVMLLLNGKVVVPSGLADIAWQYGTDMLAAKRKAEVECKAAHAPEWLTAEVRA